MYTIAMIRGRYCVVPAEDCDQKWMCYYGFDGRNGRSVRHPLATTKTWSDYREAVREAEEFNAAKQCGMPEDNVECG